MRRGGGLARSGASDRRGSCRSSWVTPLAFAAVAEGFRGRQASAASKGRQEIVAVRPLRGADKHVDLVLSSGFLSFANHAGFLKAVEEKGFKVDGVMGTSAGALSGSLYAAGYSPAEIARELSKLPPASYLQVSSKPWEGGVLNMDKVITRYRELLPATFEELDRDFAVGVYTRDGTYRVVDSGPLPEAVVASAAIPVVFEHVNVPGIGSCMDGGRHDRVGLRGWAARAAARRPGRPRKTLVHLISRSSPFSGAEEVEADEAVLVCRSPKSGVSLASLGAFDEHMQAAYERSAAQLAELMALSA